MTTFGTLLKKHRKNATDPQKGGQLTQSRFADMLAACNPELIYSASDISRWERNVRKISSERRDLLVGIVSVLVKCGEIQAVDQADNLLTTGGYAPLTDSEKRHVWPTIALPPTPAQTHSQINTRVNPLQWLRDWLAQFFRLSEIDNHSKSSWAGVFLYCFSVLTGYITPLGALIFFLALFVWIGTSWLVMPFFQWPIEEVDLRADASVRYAIGSLIVPLFIGVVTPQEAQTRFEPQTFRQNAVVLFFKMTGAYIGYTIGMFFAFAFVATLYYINQWAVPPFILWGFIGVALLLSYVSARRNPVNHHKWFDGEIKLIEGELIFLVMYGIGTFLAWFVYAFHDFLTNEVTGYALLVVLIGMAIWEQRKRASDFLPDWQLIAIIGILIPVSIYAIYIFAGGAMGDITTLSVDDFLLIFLAIEYIIAFIAVWIVVLVRNPPTFTFRGLGGVAVMLLLCNGALNYDLFLGRVFTIATFVIWFVFGRKRTQRWLNIHPAASLVYLNIALSIIALIKGWLPLWANLILFTGTTIGLCLWGYKTR